jgi:hypothetical protein
MNEHADEALAIHMPYLSQVTGAKFTVADGKIIYDQLDPFITFEKQSDWFHNPKSLYYYGNVNGAILNNFINQGIYKKVTPKVEDVVWCQNVYKELEDLQASAKKNLEQIKPEQVRQLPQGEEQLTRAKSFYENYDFLDAKQISEKLLAQTGSEEGSDLGSGK